MAAAPSGVPGARPASGARAGRPRAGLPRPRRVAAIAASRRVTTGGAMPDAFEILRADHAAVEQLLAALETSPGHSAGGGSTVVAARKQVAQRLVTDSSRHEA